MFKKFILGSVVAAAMLLTSNQANAFHGRHHRGKACHHGSYRVSTPVQSYYRAPAYGYSRSSYYRPGISVGVGGYPYGYRSGFGGYGSGLGGYRSGFGGYGIGGYPGVGIGRSGLSIGFGGVGRMW